MTKDFMDDNRTLAATLGDALRRHNLTICAAESCTGGLLLSTLTDNAGSSAYVLGGMVTYSNEAKQQFANVREDTLIAHGAVSEETAREMAEGVRGAFSADIGVGITGIAGPGGGTPEKPVGLVYVACASANGVTVVRNVWDGDRIQNKLLSVQTALTLVRKTLP